MKTTNVLPNWFRADNLKPINYYRYTSYVTDAIFRIQNMSNTDAQTYEKELAVFNALKDKSMKMNMDTGEEGKPDIRHKQWDNKIVLECLVIDSGEKVFVGYKDWTYSIGLGVSGDSWVKPYPYVLINTRENMLSSACCEGETCYCGKPAYQKIEQVIFDDMPQAHPMNRYVCEEHFYLALRGCTKQEYLRKLDKSENK